MNDRILLVDDDPELRSSLSRYLRELGYEVYQEAAGAAGVDRYLQERPDLVVMALDLPDMTGLDVLTAVREEGAVVILLTDTADTETAVRALQLGAENVLTRPVELPHLGAVVARALEKSRLRRENLLLRRAAGRDEPGQIEALGTSPMMAEIGRKVRLLAQSTRSAVLLTGERGTGKGQVARLVHRLGPLADRPFVQVNCADRSPAVLADELFGHEKGAFADARKSRPGLLEMVSGGVLFLDRVDDLSSELQLQLLHLLQDGTYRRLGGARDISVSVRLIAASHRNLVSAVREGDFREDLFRRLNADPLYLPPLRERAPEDRAALIHRIHGEVKRSMGRPEQELSDDALQCMVDYEWPGNIREMHNVVERAVIFSSDSDIIYRDHLPIELQRERRRAPGRGFRAESLEEVEERHIVRMLRHHEGNRTHAAQDLGIARATLINKIRRYDLDL